ncbi:MAG: tripartite tricarboxylate transporter substrate binding protein [Oscillospiraceae bacterium]|nr:tripartite tricarboxylate transporter substrate binding protein [Oscillospiraceae bacterium]
MKKLLSLILAAVLTLALTACGNKTETPVEPGPEETPTETAWPERPIEIIIPYGAGGDTDFNARAYVEGLTKELGVSVAATNVTGSGGSVASRQVKDAAPDGYQVLFFHSAINVNEVIGVADFGIQDFKLAAIVAKSPGEIIAVRSDSGFKTLKDMYDYSKEHPGEIKVAMDTGTMVHVQSLMLQQAGFDVSLVDVGGASDRVAALAGGHVDVIINAYGTIKDYIESGEFTALAQTNGERSDGYPEIPTAAEQGYDLTLEKHYFFAFPKDTPQEYVDKFAAACKTVNETPEYAASIMEAFRQEPFYADADQGMQYMADFKAVVESFVSELVAG